MESLGKPAGSVWAQQQWNINSFFWGVIAPDFYCWMGGVHCLCFSHSGQLLSLQCFTLLQLLWYLQWSHSMQSPHSFCHSRPSYLPSLCLNIDFNISVSLLLFFFSLFLSSGQVFGFMRAALRPAGPTACPSLCPPCPTGLWLSSPNWEETLLHWSTMGDETCPSFIHQSIHPSMSNPAINHSSYTHSLTGETNYNFLSAIS